MITSLSSRAFLVILATTFAVVGVVLGACADVRAQQGGMSFLPSGPPAAVVKKIVVGNREQTEATAAQATVTRGTQTVPVVLPFLLYKDDLIQTYGDTHITVRFLDDPVPQRENEVIIGPEAAVAISSTDSWYGRLWAKVKGNFQSRSRYARLGATGTEYEFFVPKQGEASLVVIEGSVQVEEGDVTLTGPRPNISFLPTYPEPRSALFQLANFSKAVVPQEQFGRALDIRAGQIEILSTTYHIKNDCNEAHRIELRTSENASWLKLEIDPQQPQRVSSNAVLIRATQNLPIRTRLEIDATNLPVGQYRGAIRAVCVDCANERSCPGQELTFPLLITVQQGPTPSPTPQTFVVKQYEQSRLTRGIDSPTQASVDRLRAVLDWTTPIIVITQPSYSAERLIPNFGSASERGRNFREARERVVLERDAAGNETLGDVYSDWGQGALAIAAYEKSANITPRQRPGDAVVDRSEALRMTGQLNAARALAMTNADGKSGKAQNLLGNIYFDYGRIAADKRDKDATRYFEQAAAYYAAALTPTGSQATRTIQTNLAKIHISEGDFLLQTRLSATGSQAIDQSRAPQMNAQLAKTKYTTAMQLLAEVQTPDSTYPFGVIELGRAYQGLGNTSMLLGSAAEAKVQRDQAAIQYNRVISAHPDCAEAYFNLGDLAEDSGDQKAAKDHYRRAIAVRPEQPASYYSLALLLQTENPQLAKALAETYLKLELADFKQGEKASNAQKVARGEWVNPPERIVTAPTKIAAPNVVGKTLVDATALIETAGFVRGKIERRGDPQPDGLIVSQTPPAGATLEPSSVIDLVVSAGRGPDTTVPDVINRSQADAKSLIEAADLKVGRIELRRDNSKPKDVVLKQSPSSGKTVKRGSVVELTVSATKPVEVPDVIDDKEGTARRKMADKGLVVRRVDYRPSCDVGEVIETNPVRRTVVEPGSPVDLVIGSLGEDPVSVPNFVGSSGSDAQAEIRQRFVLGRIRREETDNVAPGNVIEQSPRAGTLFARVCPFKVDLTVAEPLTTVGSYVGLSETEARQRVSEIRLLAVVRNRESSDNPGFVMAQSPSAGSRVKKNSPVTLFVSIPQTPTVPVPSVVGMSVLEAKAAIENAQLRVGNINYERPPPTARAVFPCRVTRQDPLKEQRVRIGTPVNLWAIGFDAHGKAVDCLKPNIIGRLLTPK